MEKIQSGNGVVEKPISKSLQLKKSSPLYDTPCFKRNHIKQLCCPPLTIFVHIKHQKGARGALTRNSQSCQERATSSGAPGARYFFQERGAGARYISPKSSGSALHFCQK